MDAQSGTDTDTNTDATGSESERPFAAHRPIDNYYFAKGFLWYDPRPKGKDTAVSMARAPQMLCARIDVRAILASDATGYARNSIVMAHGDRLIAFRSNVVNKPADLNEAFSSEDIYLAEPSNPRNGSLIGKFINDSIAYLKPPRGRELASPGWSDDFRSYMLANGNRIGQTDSTDVLLKASDKRASTKGDLGFWKSEVAPLMETSPIVAVVMLAALSSPFRALMGWEVQGFHLHCTSKSGKTTLFELAAALFGNPRDEASSWNGTPNAIEDAAASYNDSVYVLDELGTQSQNASTATFIFRLCEGKGRRRLRRDATAAPQARWRTTILSAGERTLEEIAGKKHETGASLRFIKITNDSRLANNGVFRNPPIAPLTSFATWCRALRGGVADNHGKPGQGLIRHLTSLGPEVVRARARQAYDNFVARFPQAAGDEGQQGKIIGAFAELAAVVPFLNAVFRKIQDDKSPFLSNVTDRIYEVARVCLEAHGADGGGSELQKLIAVFSLHIDTYSERSFGGLIYPAPSNLSAADRYRPPEEHGTMQGVRLYTSTDRDNPYAFGIPNGIFEAVAASASVGTLVASRLLKDAGFLIPKPRGDTQANQHHIKCGAKTSARPFYVLKAEILGDRSDDAAGDAEP